MKLDGFDGQFLVPNSHDDAAVDGLRGHFKTGRERRPARVEGVVAAYLKFLGQSLEDAHSAVAHHGTLAVHGVVEHVQVAAECFHNAL